MTPFLRVRVRRTAAHLTLALFTLGAFAPAASAQSSSPGGPQTAHLSLVDQPLFYRPGDRLDLVLEVTNLAHTPIRGLKVVVSAYDRVGSRSALHEVYAGSPGYATSSFPKDFPALSIAPGRSAMVTLRNPLDDLPTLDQADSDGIYPLSIAIFDESGSAPLDTLYTPAVYYIRPPDPPLDLALVMPLNAIPGRGPQGHFVPGTGGDYPLEDAVAPGGWLRGVLEAVAAVRKEADEQRARRAAELRRQRGTKGKHGKGRSKPPKTGPVLPRLHLGIAPTAELVDELVDMADGYRRVRDGGAHFVGRSDPPARDARAVLSLLREDLQDPGTQTLLTPYSFADLPSLTRNFSFEDGGVGVQLAEARRTLEDDLGIEPSRHWLFPPGGRLGLATLQLLPIAFSGDVTRTFFSDESLRAPPDPAQSGCPAVFGSLACPVQVETEQGDVFVGYRTDADLQSLMGRISKRGNDRLDIQRLMAETAMIREESPGASHRVVQVDLPAFWQPSPGTAEALFEDLVTAPWLKTVTPSQGLAGGREPVPREALRALSPAPQQPPASYFQSIAAAQASIDSFASMDPPPGMVARLRRDTLVAQGRAWWRTPSLTERGLDLARSAQSEASRQMHHISIVAGSDITLTSRRGRIRLDLANGAAYPLRVALIMASGKLSFGGENKVRRIISVKGGGQRALDVNVSTKASGAFPLTITIETPDGSVAVAAKQLTVHSTEYNRIALALTVGALAFLVLFYATRPLRRRRARRREQSQQGTEAHV